jgi:hypothetical protein
MATLFDPAVLAALKAKLEKLLPYRRGVRPVLPTSLPQFVDAELQRSEVFARDIVDTLKGLTGLVDGIGNLPDDPIGEAPEDGKLYGRQDGDWLEVPAPTGGGLEDAPADGLPYIRQDAAWQPLDLPDPPEPGVPEAPQDGTLYARRDAEWAPVPDAPPPGIEEAPVDDSLYARFNGYWTSFYPGVQDAPADDNLYARFNGDWTTFSPGIGDAPADGQSYVRKDNGWQLAPEPETPEPSAQPYRPAFFFTTAPTASEVLFVHSFSDAATFPDNWLGSTATVGTNPAATFVLDIQKRSGTGSYASVGTISIATSGAVTFNTTGAEVSFSVGDALRVVAPATAGTAAHVAVTFKGTA